MIEFRCRRHAKDGTPIIRDEEIADYAGELIRDYDETYLEEPWLLNSLKFSEYYLGADLDFVDIYCEEGEQIAGATVFNRENIRLFDRENMRTRCETFEAGTILIDNATMEEGKEAFARFTILHEAGHLCMHQGVFRKDPGQMTLFECMEPGAPKNVVCCRKSGIERKGKLMTQEDFREHQANVFAAAVTMPRQAFTEEAVHALRLMGCQDDYYILPTLRETDHDECADSLAAYMGKKFRVSKTAARVQLRKYGLVRTSWEVCRGESQMRFA